MKKLVNKVTNLNYRTTDSNSKKINYNNNFNLNHKLQQLF